MILELGSTCGGFIVCVSGVWDFGNANRIRYTRLQRFNLVMKLRDSYLKGWRCIDYCRHYEQIFLTLLSIRPLQY